MGCAPHGCWWQAEYWRVYFFGDLDNNSVTEFIDDSKMWSAVSQYGDRIGIQGAEETGLGQPPRRAGFQGT